MSDRARTEDFAKVCAERGRHEEYMREGGETFCRQCGVILKQRVKQTTPYVGQRVILNTLLREGDFPGTIIEIGGGIIPIERICRVKLDCQEKPVSDVEYYDAPPGMVATSRWQCCYPIESQKENNQGENNA